jgi:hypothetical protein
MNLIDLLSQNKLSEAKDLIFSRLNDIAACRLEEAKRYAAENTYDVEQIDEAGTPNRIKIGRVIKIRRRIRRNAKGRIVVQKNIRRSAIKGYAISGNTVKRIPAIQRINKARKLKRYWKTKGKARLGRTLLKRKMSMRRRQSMGIR